MEAELDVDDETEDKQSTWVRVCAALSPSNSHILHPPSPTLRSISAHLLHSRSRPPDFLRPRTCADVRRLQRNRQRLHGRGK